MRLPNKGRCDHTYAYYMVNYAHTLLDDEVVVFIKDTRIIHQAGSYRTLLELLRLVDTSGFGCYLTPGPYAVWHDTRMLGKFSKDTYVGVSGSAADPKSFKSVFSDMADWWEHIGMPPLQPVVPVCYGGSFAASASAIYANQKAWRIMEALLSRDM